MNATEEKKVQNETRKPKFKLTKHHLQGAVAMLLVFVIAISALAVTPGLNLFGTVFKGYEDAEELPISIEPGEIEARADYAGETFTLTGLPEGELKKIKPEHVFLGGYLGTLAVTGLEVNTQDDTLLVTIGAGESANDADAVDWERCYLHHNGRNRGRPGRVCRLYPDDKRLAGRAFRG